MVTLELLGTWTLTIGDDLRVRCSNASVQKWAQAMIDSHEPPTNYIPDMAYYHASRIAEYPGWHITKVEAEPTVKGRIY